MPSTHLNRLTFWAKKRLAQIKIAILWFWIVERWTGYQNRLRYTRWRRQLDESLSASQANSSQLPSFSFSLVFFDGGSDLQRTHLTINSIFRQNYTHWKLLVISQHDFDLPSDWIGNGLPVEVVKLSGNSPFEEALKHLTGDELQDFVAFIRPGDVLAPGALLEFAGFIAKNPDIDLAYSDEDRIDARGRHSSPTLKPDWSPDLLFSGFYIGLLTFFRREMVTRSAEDQDGSPFADEYGLALHFASKTKRIGHLPKVLCSRSYVGREDDQLEYRDTLTRAVQQQDALATVGEITALPGHFKVHWPLKGAPLISVVICTRDQPHLLSRCLVSIFRKSLYPHFEVVLVDNGSRQAETRDLIEEWKKREPERFSCSTLEMPFNFSALNNQGAARSRGELILFLNNDVEVISPEWLEEMAAQAQRPSIAAVGALLLYPNGTVQHAGIIVGGPGLAVHSHYRYPAGSDGYMGRLKIASNYSAVTAACMMIRRNLFASQGGFDEHLAMAYGDVELCLRLRQAGYFNIILPYIQLYHSESATRGFEDTGEKQARLDAEKSYVLNRWAELLRQDPFYHPWLSRERGDFSFDI